MLSYLDNRIDTIVSGGIVDTIYFEFAIAFNGAPHKRLPGKLKSCGINEKVSEWIRAFLSNRRQIVIVNGMKSDPATVLSGIPQGSVLGPILVVIYINNLPEVVKSSTYVFADDTKIFRQITTKEDALHLQSDIISLEQWSQKWLLTFHPKKCHVLTLGKFCNITHTEKNTLLRKELEHDFEQEDLGVILDAELKFDEHILVKVKKANAMAGLIRRTFSYLDGLLFKKLFTTFVRPHLESGQVILTPYLKKIYNYSGKCAKPNHKIDGLLSSHELPRKAKKTESTIVGLRESSRQFERDYQAFLLLRQLYATQKFQTSKPS